MTIKVVHGVVREMQGSSHATTPSTAMCSQGQGSLAGQAVQSAVQNDAAVTSLRCTRLGPENERVKDYKEAKSVARDVADQVKYEGDGVQAHGTLSYVSSQGHFVEQ